MKTLRKIQTMVATLTLMLCASLALAAPTSTSRPISDFVSKQGTAFSRDVGPVAGGELIYYAQFIWATSLNQVYYVDYSGSANRAFMKVGIPDIGTTYAGSVTETVLPDGRAEVIVHLETYKAYAGAIDITDQSKCNNGGHTTNAACPAIFGYNLVELANGVPNPVLANSVMDIKFINTRKGAPLPDIVTLSFTPSATGTYLKSINLMSTTLGPLREAFGVKEGTKGLVMTDVLIDTALNIDNEEVTIRVLGK